MNFESSAVFGLDSVFYHLTVNLIFYSIWTLLFFHLVFLALDFGLRFDLIFSLDSGPELRPDFGLRFWTSILDFDFGLDFDLARYICMQSYPYTHTHYIKSISIQCLCFVVSPSFPTIIL